MKKFQNIVVAIDSNDSVGELLAYSESLAQQYHAKIWIVQVATPNPDFGEFETGPQYLREMKAEELREEHKLLQRLCDQFLDQDIESEALLIQGSTVETVLAETKKLHADLLILGTHKHGFFYNLVAESVSQKLFEKANLPLLIIPIESKVS